MRIRPIGVIRASLGFHVNCLEDAGLLEISQSTRRLCLPANIVSADNFLTLEIRVDVGEFEDLLADL